MSNSNTRHKALEKLALEIISKREKANDLVLLDTDQDVVPSTGKSIFRFRALKKNAPNGPQYAVVLDEAANVVDLERSEKKKFFERIPPRPEPEPVKFKPFPIDPETNDLILEPGDKFCEDIKVTVPECPVKKKVDVYFLADTTGSMGEILETVRERAVEMLQTLTGNDCIDFAFGVGNYKDFPEKDKDGTLLNAYAFQHQQSLTKNTFNVNAAIGNWTAGQGSDYPEGQLYALTRLAAGSGIGWRTGADKYVVWFGDAPGHEPIDPSLGTSNDPVGTLIDLSTVIADLQGAKITVLAISTVTDPTKGLNDDPVQSYNDYADLGLTAGGLPGQANAIKIATNGEFVPGVNSTTIVDTIVNLILNAVLKINNLSLVATGDIAPFVTISPKNGYGPLSTRDEQELVFDVSFKGVVECGCKEQVFTGTIDAVADRVVVVQKKVKITVPPCRYTYSVKFVCGVQQDSGCGGCSPVRPGTYATEINIHNAGNFEARIEKRLIPVVLAGVAVGREPKYAGIKARDKIILPPSTATMDDCCRITELLMGAVSPSPPALNIGFLEIISDRELNVTAVYTASDPKSGAVSIDVEQIEGKHR